MCIDGAFADKELVRVRCKSGVPRATDSVASCNVPLAVWDMAKNAASHRQAGGRMVDMMERGWNRASSQRPREHPILAQNDSTMASMERPWATRSTRRISHTISKRVRRPYTDNAACSSVGVARTRQEWDVPS